MKTRLFFPLLILALGFVGCSSPQRYTRNRMAGDEWLAKQKQPAKINIAGGWKSEDWGAAVFAQGSRRITGQIDQYVVTGVISGSKAYLTISEGGWIYYTAELSLTNKNTLEGVYSKSVPFNPDRAKSMLLHRVN